MQGQTHIVTTLLTVLVGFVLAGILGYVLFGILESAKPETTSYRFVVPPKLEAVRQEGNTLKLLLHNPNTTELEIPDSYVRITRNGEEIDSVRVSGITISPGSTGILAVEVNIPEAGTYLITLVGEYVAQIYEDLGSTAPPEVSFTSGLTFSYVLDPLEGNRYSGILFYGDYNTAYFTVKGPPGVYTLTSDCAAPSSCTIAQGSDTCTITTDTNRASLNCSFSMTHSGAAVWSATIPVFYLYYCSTEPDCEGDLNTSLNNTDSNTVIFMSGDISVGVVDVPQGDYGWRVNFDGNGHTLSTDGSLVYVFKSTTGGTRLVVRSVRMTSGDSGISLYGGETRIVDATVVASSYGLALESLKGTATKLEDVRLVSDLSEALHVREDAVIYLDDTNVESNVQSLYMDYEGLWNDPPHIERAVNSYCFVGTDPTPYPILSIGPESNGTEVNLQDYGGSVCHITVHHARDINIVSGGIGTAGTASRGPLVTYYTDNLLLNDVNVEAGDWYGTYLFRSTATFINSKIQASSHVLTFGDTNITLKGTRLYGGPSGAEMVVHSCSQASCGTAYIIVDLSESNTLAKGTGYDWYASDPIDLVCTGVAGACLYYLESNLDDSVGTFTYSCACWVP